jgi:hypothetical protein
LDEAAELTSVLMFRPYQCEERLLRDTGSTIYEITDPGLESSILVKDKPVLWVDLMNGAYEKGAETEREKLIKAGLRLDD